MLVFTAFINRLQVSQEPLFDQLISHLTGAFVVTLLA